MSLCLYLVVYTNKLPKLTTDWLHDRCIYLICNILYNYFILHTSDNNINYFILHATNYYVII